MILLQSLRIILHLEFQTDPDLDMQAWAKEDAERELRISVEHEIGESVALQKARSIALNFIRQGISLDIIAQATGLSIEQLQNLEQDPT